MSDGTEVSPEEVEDQRLLLRGHRSHRKRMLAELILAICGVLIVLGFGMAHLSGIHGPLHHPGVILGVAGIAGALTAGISWAVNSPQWFVDEVLGHAAEIEIERRGV